MLDCSDVSDDPLASAVCLANDTLADKFFELSLAHFQIGTDDHKYYPRPEINVAKYYGKFKQTLRKYFQHAPMLSFPAFIVNEEHNI